MTEVRKNGREAETKEEIDRCEERKLGDERRYENDTDGDAEQCHLKNKCIYRHKHLSYIHKNKACEGTVCIIYPCSAVQYDSPG